MTSSKVVKSIFKAISVGFALLVAIMVLLAACVRSQQAKSVAPLEATVALPVVSTGVTITNDMAMTKGVGDAPITMTIEISGTGEFRSSDKVGTGYVLVLQQGSSDKLIYQPVQYYNIDGQAILEGDIALGSVEKMASLDAEITADPDTGFATAIDGSQYRWPGGVIPFIIAPALPNVARVNDAINHWHQLTRIRLITRTDEQDFVTFIPGDGCSSSVGKQGGQQFITLAPNCDLGNVIHEIGHTVGLWHEQSREDRDLHVRILWDNIESNQRLQFARRIISGADLGSYDYDSIMHYPTWAFSNNGQSTIVARDGRAIGQRNGLSYGDIQGVAAMYPLPQVGGFTSPPSAVSWGKNRLDVFGLGANREMYHLGWDGLRWSSDEGIGRWESLGGEFSDSPIAVSWGENRLDVFGLGVDQKLYHLARNDSQWVWAGGFGQWESLGFTFASSPSVVSWGENRLDVFGLGTNNKIYHLAWDGSQWISGAGVRHWEALGDRKFTSSPSAVSWGENRLDVFGLGTDRKIYHLAWNGAQWSSDKGKIQWEPLAEPLGSKFSESQPIAVSWGENRIDVFGLNTELAMLHLGWDGSQWSSSKGVNQWESLGGDFRSPPSVVSWGENRLDVFGLDKDRVMLHLYWDGAQWVSNKGVEQWESLDGKFTYLAPSAVSRGENRLDLFGVGVDQAMLHRAWDGSQWSIGWKSLGGGREP